MSLRLVRGAFHPDKTFGMLSDEEIAFAVTLEPERDHNRPTEWKNGVKVRGGACIPAGRYWFEPRTSPKFGETYRGTGIPHRDEVLFHALNVDEQSDGCIGIGHGFDPVQVGGAPTEDGIVQSAKEFREFMVRMKAKYPKGFWLDVIDAIPER